MRFELSGSLIHPEPLVIRFDSNQPFIVTSYLDLGYTHFEVICIGAGGGRGGGINTGNTGTGIRNFGGEGGGGGYHRVRGLLSALPSNCPVTVGVAGGPGIDQINTPASTTNGGDGTSSTFNGTTCRASGGEGGKRAQSNSDTIPPQSNGGDGGIGDRTIAGGGGFGGVAGTPAPGGPYTVPSTSGQDGSFFNNVGKGGGGGAGGIGLWGGTTALAATSGGRGSYNPGDTSVYGPGDPPSIDVASTGGLIVPGKASGAKAAPLNGLPTVFGKSGAPGVVVIRLTAE